MKALTPATTPLTTREFVAVTDDMLYDHPELFTQLIPYHVDRPCRRLASTPLWQTPADIQKVTTKLTTGSSHKGTGIHE